MVDFLKEMDALVAKVVVDAPLVDTLRNVHTVKGSCAIQGVLSVASLCHEIECRMAEDGAIGASSVELLRGRWAAFRENVNAFAGSRFGHRDRGK